MTAHGVLGALAGLLDRERAVGTLDPGEAQVADLGVEVDRDAGDRDGVPLGADRPRDGLLAPDDVLDVLGRVRSVGGTHRADDEARHVDVEALDVRAAGDGRGVDADAVQAGGVGPEVRGHDLAQALGERGARVRARGATEGEDVVGGAQVVGHAPSLRRG
ncbi:hypothetical protein D3C74_371010 [compost metagenome]